MSADDKSSVMTHEWTPGEIMSPEFWVNSWSKGESKGFHLDHVCGLVKKYISTMQAGRKHIKVLVPFCGKDVCMKWLAEQGHTVVGIECAKQACEEFFAESKLEYTTETVGKFIVFKSKEGSITLYCGNLYDFSPDLDHNFEAVWDRGALNAVNSPERTKYAELMMSLMAPDCVSLITTFDSEDPKIQEEWECLSDDDFIKYFGARCDVELRVECVNAAHYNEGLDMTGMETMMEKLTIVRPKKSTTT